MLNFDIKRKINTLRDILVGKVPDPKAQVEQITIALIYKFMDDMDLQAAEFGGEREFFKGDYEKYAFSQIMLAQHSAQERLYLYAEGIEKMTNNPDLPKLFRDILRNAYIPYRDPETLNLFLKEIAEFSYDDSEELGNAFEYLLSIMGSQGDAGQFRTPRHIIDMMVEIIAPAKNETILDPACGTAGFLISAYNFIKRTNLDENGKSTLVADDMTRMTRYFAGYDISPDMVRLSRVNMYLHGFTTPNISEYDTLTSLDKWDDTFDVIFSNPPFMTPKGGINPHNRYQVSAKRAEVLFVDYIAEHLNPTGRAAIIVPEGIVFQSQTAYKNLRKMLVDNNYLYGVISLPAGVFNPYSGVKTSILLLDRTLAKKRDSILFVKVNNDGFDLGAQRREIKGSELPNVINIFKDYQQGVSVEGRENVVLAKKSEIAGQDYILIAERYKKSVSFNSRWPLVSIGETCEVERGASPRPISAFITEDPEGINWIKIGDGKTNSLFIDSTEERITKEGARKSRFVKKGDLILSNSMSYGRPYILNIDGCVHDGWLIIHNVKDLFNPIYLCYVLGSDTIMAEYQRLATGGVVNNLNSELVRNCKIPLPPLTVQEEIVAEIEGYQKIIDGARQVVENYKPSIKIDPSWSTRRFDSLCENLDSKRVPITSSDRIAGNIPYYGASGIVDYVQEYIFDEPLLLVSEDGANLIARVTPIAFSIEGKSWVNNHAHVLRFANFNLQKYVEFYINQMDISLYVTGAAQPKLNQENLNRIEMKVPPENELVDIIHQIETEIEIVEQNKRLIEIFQQKIKDKIAEVWG